MIVIALIADIVKSREIEKRYHYQEGLKSRFEEINRNSRSLLSPYTITLGDEFQAVYRSGKAVMGDILAIMAESHPEQIRFALGIERLTTAVNPSKALGMDGPAFHSAREGLEKLKKEKSGACRVYGVKEGEWALLNSSIMYAMKTMTGWKRNNILILEALYRGAAIGEIAVQVGITERAVYKAVNLRHMNELVDLLMEIDEKIAGACP